MKWTKSKVIGVIALSVAVLGCILGARLLFYPYRIGWVQREQLAILQVVDFSFEVTGLILGIIAVCTRTRVGRALGAAAIVLSVVNFWFLADCGPHSVVSKRNVCYNFQRMIEGGQEQVALAAGLTNGASVEAKAIAEYIKDNTIPKCPSGGTYSFGIVGEPVECSLHGSVENPKNIDKY